MSFWARWVWPAGGSGGIPGDVVATAVWVVLAAIVGTLVYPPLRRRASAFLKRHLASESAELHRKLDHIIKNHPDIPDLDDDGVSTVWTIWWVLVATAVVLFMIGDWPHVWTLTGAADESGTWYGFWSGFGGSIPDFLIIGSIVGVYRHHNCGVHRCWRLSKLDYDLDGTVHKVCRRHHPNAPKRLTHEHLLAHNARSVVPLARGDTVRPTRRSR